MSEPLPSRPSLEWLRKTAKDPDVRALIELGGLVHLHALGRDVLEVLVEIEHDSKTYHGTGLSTDIIEASAQAYLKALNKAAVSSHSEATMFPSPQWRASP